MISCLFPGGGPQNEGRNLRRGGGGVRLGLHAAHRGHSQLGARWRRRQMWTT